MVASLETTVDKLDVDELKNVPLGLDSFKSKIHKLDVDKLVLIPVGLKKNKSYSR